MESDHVDVHNHKTMNIWKRQAYQIPCQRDREKEEDEMLEIQIQEVMKTRKTSKTLNQRRIRHSRGRDKIRGVESDESVHCSKSQTPPRKRLHPPGSHCPILQHCTSHKVPINEKQDGMHMCH